MNNRRNSHSSLPESEESKDSKLTCGSKESSTTLSLLQLLSRFLRKIQIIAIFAGILSRLTQLASKLSKSLKKGATIATLITAMVLAGHAVSAQVASPPSLKTVAVPQPDNLGDFIKDKVAAIALGKALFWDMQVGSDGNTSCASCHFHAGADSRSKNQINPGTIAQDYNFKIGGAPNYQLKPDDYPFDKENNDVTSSQGVFNTQFRDIEPGRVEDKVDPLDDPVFNVGGTNVRRVQPRNTPTVINAVFNFRNFWDGRAQNEFNGVNPFGLRDKAAKIVKAEKPNQLKEVSISLKNSSLASQAVGPPLSDFEMSARDRTFEDIGHKFSKGKKNKLPREVGKKLLFLRPLGKQLVAPDDSVLGTYSRAPETGLGPNYESLVKAAFKPEWWNSNQVVRVNGDNTRTFIKNPASNFLATNEYTLMQYNFSLFFGLAVQMYESTLVSNDTPFDRFAEGNNNALTEQQKQGLNVFQTKGLCINCHSGPEFTAASVTSVQEEPLDRMEGTAAIYDTGFNNTAVRPTREDLAIGDVDPFGNPLSLSRLAQRDGSISANEPVVADGGFKVPGLRNVELTAPYFHNGGQLTLLQVVEFYNRGGDFDNGEDQDPDIHPLQLSEDEIEALVAFMKGLTDERVRYHKAPFDHPQMFIPNGHLGNQTSVTNDGTGKATDQLLEIPAVGRNGLNVPLKNFLE